jgi:hypothetical protein
MAKGLRLVLTGEDINYPVEPKFMQERDLVSRTMGSIPEIVQNDNAYFFVLGSDPSTVNYTGGLDLRTENAQLVVTLDNSTAGTLNAMLNVISFVNATWRLGDYKGVTTSNFTYYKV